MIGTDLDLDKLWRVAEDTLNAQRETASGLRGEQRRIEADQMWGLTANPGAILSLLDRFDALQAELDEARAELAARPRSYLQTLEAETDDTAEGGETCQSCARRYRLIYRVPNDVWARIAPCPETLGPYVEHQGGGLLCPDCASDAAAKFGITLYFDASIEWGVLRQRDAADDLLVNSLESMVEGWKERTEVAEVRVQELEAERDTRLPCDVRLPRLTLKQGVAVSVLLEAIRSRQGWTDEALKEGQHDAGVEEEGAR